MGRSCYFSKHQFSFTKSSLQVLQTFFLQQKSCWQKSCIGQYYSSYLPVTLFIIVYMKIPYNLKRFALVSVKKNFPRLSNVKSRLHAFIIVEVICLIMHRPRLTDASLVQSRQKCPHVLYLCTRETTRGESMMSLISPRVAIISFRSNDSARLLIWHCLFFPSWSQGTVEAK